MAVGVQVNIRRTVRYAWQRLTRGWDDSDMWSLDCSLAKLIAPRLRRFRDLDGGVFGGIPASYCDTGSDGMPVATEAARNRYRADLDKMIAAFEFAASKERWDEHRPEVYARHDEGIKLFAEHFWSLWT